MVPGIWQKNLVDEVSRDNLVDFTSGIARWVRLSGTDEERGLVMGTEGGDREVLDRPRYRVDHHAAHRDEWRRPRPGEHREQLGHAKRDGRRHDPGDRPGPPAPRISHSASLTRPVPAG